jgi:hypothetical protein
MLFSVSSIPVGSKFLSRYMGKITSFIITQQNAYTVDSGETNYGIEPKYLQIYVYKFGFHFHRRNTPMAAFQSLLGISTRESSLLLYELVNRSQPYRHLPCFLASGRP